MSIKSMMLSIVVLLLIPSGIVVANNLSPQEELGKSIFFDRNLSINGNQSCASCHGKGAGWTGPISRVNSGGSVYEGSIAGRFGNRKPPSAAYATTSPILHYLFENNGALFIGGNFWDGRATGEVLGNPAADQAQGPFLNPVEQALPDNACVAYRVCNASYDDVSFTDVWGDDACAINWPTDVEQICETEGAVVALSAADYQKVLAVYDKIALSIAGFEASAEVNAFSSKFDYYKAGLTRLSRKERRGRNFFVGKGKCANCHILDPGPNGEPPLLTDYTFDNLGVPKNPENPWYTMPAQFNPLGAQWLDYGLGGFLASRVDYQQFSPESLGKQKVPTLRNVDKRPYRSFVKAFGHNGYFKSLKGIVHFYNTRDTKPRCANPLTTEADALLQNCWPAPEIDANVNVDELGNLGLSSYEEDAIVAFLKTLSDGWEYDD